jgi:hypothetical protein
MNVIKKPLNRKEKTMKTKILTVMFVFFFCMSMTAHADLTDGLVAYYPFDGNANDSSGNGNNAIAYNNYGYVDGVFSNAIHLVGSGHTGLNGGHVTLPFIALNEYPAFTLSIWVNYEGSTSGAGDSFIEFGARTDPSGGGKIVTIMWEWNNTIVFGLGDRYDDAGVSIPFPSDFIGNWYHLVLRADNGTLTAFVNGQLVGTDYYQQLGPMSPVAGLGCHWFNSGGTSSNRFIGSIDEVRIYNRALSDSEIEKLAAPELIAPNGKESIPAGSQYTVKWVENVPSTIANVKVEYSTNNGQSWQGIAANTPNDGAYEWAVPAVTSNQCLIRISDADNSSAFDISDGVFSIFVCLDQFSMDFNHDCYVGLADFAEFALQWLSCANPLDPSCLSFTLDKGLVAHYKLEDISGAVIDEMGTYNGTNNGATIGVTGVDGNAYEFNGINNYIDTIPQTNMPSVISVSMWVYPTKETGAHIWGSVENASWGKDGYVAAYGPDKNVVLDYYSGNVYCGAISTPQNAIQLNTWSFLTFTVDSSNNVKIYVNSIEKGSGSISVSPTSHDRALMIGSGILSQNNPYAFKGIIDDVRIYNRPLQETEIQSLFGEHFEQAGLLAYYPFDGDTKDYSGKNRDAAAYNDYEYVDGILADGIHLVGSGHTGLNGGHVILPFIALNEFPSFTLSIWVNYEGSTSGAGDSFIEFGARTDPYGGGPIVSIAWEWDNTLGFGVGDVEDNAGMSIPFPSDFIGNWYHLVLRADNGTLTAFVNGQLVGTDYYQQIGTMSSVAGIGCHWFNSGGTESNRFIGTVDEVRIYERALNETEIQSLYANP